jgi:hypothetical protein
MAMNFTSVFDYVVEVGLGQTVTFVGGAATVSDEIGKKLLRFIEGHPEFGIALNDPNVDADVVVTLKVLNPDDLADGANLVWDADLRAAVAGAGGGTGGGSVNTVNGVTPDAGGNVALAPADIGAATAAQGAKADTAVQPGSLGTAASADSTDFATAAQGALAASAVQPATMTAAIDALVGGAPGLLDTLGEIAAQLEADETTAGALTNTVAGKMDKTANLSDLADLPTARDNLGLGSAAIADSSAFATAAQGTKADTAIQPADLVTVARMPARSLLAAYYDGSTWEARPTADTQKTVFYFALTAADPTPADFVSGVDYLFKPGA